MTGSEASADDFEATTPEGIHPGIRALGDEDGDFSCRDDFAAATSKHAQRYGESITALCLLTPVLLCPTPTMTPRTNIRFQGWTGVTGTLSLA